MEPINRSLAKDAEKRFGLHPHLQDSREVIMGSGYSGLYSGTRGSSQPYASSYKVVPSMHARDLKQETVCNDDGEYYTNPSATNIADTVSNRSIVYQGQKANGRYTYVVDTHGNFIFGKRDNPRDPRSRSPHPMLIGGKNPRVKMAGMIEIRNGKIFSIDNNSGHYRPPKKSLEAAEKALAKLPREVFHRKSKWRNND